MFLPDSNIGKWVAWFAAIVGISLAVRDFFHFVDDKAEVISASVIAGLLVFFVLYSIVREALTSRKEKYANINSHRHQCIHIVRDLITYLEKEQCVSHNERTLKQIRSITSQLLTKFLNEFAVIFSMLTGTNCRATIKAIYRKEDKLYVYTLARDETSRNVNWKKDQERFEKDADPIDKNEDFQILYKDYGPNNRCFFCNDLTIRRNYETSSFDAVQQRPAMDITITSRIRAIFSWKDDWPLPYRSTIVWPTQQSPNPEIQINKPECIGFLAIDSESRNVFKERWDFYIGAEVADALFHALRAYLKVAPLKKEKV